MPLDMPQWSAHSDATQLMRVQQLLGVQLPADYVSHLQSLQALQAGGRFPIRWQPGQAASQDWPDSALSHLHPLDPDNKQGLVQRNRVRAAGLVPDDCLVIGRDTAGNALLMAFAPHRFQHILFAASDYVSQSGWKTEEQHIGWVAHSFSEWLARMRGEPVAAA